MESRLFAMLASHRLHCDLYKSDLQIEFLFIRDSFIVILTGQSNVQTQFDIGTCLFRTAAKAAHDGWWQDGGACTQHFKHLRECVSFVNHQRLA
jgi:hypothetical protein